MTDKLEEYCLTENQKEIIRASLRITNQAEAARSLGMDHSNFSKAVKKVRERAAKAGYAPDNDMVHESAPGFGIKKVSTMYGAEGEVKLQWVQSSPEAEQMQEAMEAAIKGFADELPRAFAIPEQGTHLNTDIINLFAITDFHLGMYSWKEETGDDWDTDIAVKMLIDWFSTAIALSPNAETAILANIADLMHWDGVDAVTPTSGHLLDADTRFQRLIRVAIKALRAVIQMLLEKHKYVYIIMAEGNHDPASSMWLREWFSVFYENEPRVTVDVSPKPYYCYEFGDVALFFHHGHKRKVANVDTVFVGMFREVFGRTKYAYAHMGHLHSIDVKETNLMVVEQHRTLAAPDAYAARGGWISGRDAKVITYHKEFGEVARNTISADMIKRR